MEKRFCGENTYQTPLIGLASARAGNVVGGGDWAKDRIIPDTIRALEKNIPVFIRNPDSTRPWQHVLEPLSGYLELAKLIYLKKDNLSLCSSFNFGPKIESNKSVKSLLEEIFKHWPGEWTNDKNLTQYHESKILNLQIDKAYNFLGWEPKWNFYETIEKTTNWYKKTIEGSMNPLEMCIEDISCFMSK